jgi:hypothetical protein
MTRVTRAIPAPITLATLATLAIPAPPRAWPRVLALLVVFAAVFAMAGCTPHIGDKCVLSTDCSVQGTLVCDTSQPGGYCTQLNCARGSCPSNSLCVMFQASVPGCAYDDYQSPSRTGRSFCMENCSQESDCRSGYVCADPAGSQWNGAILDDNQSQGVCIAPPPAGLSKDGGPRPDAAICQPYDADAALGDDGGGDASADAADAPSEGAADGGIDAAGEGGAEAGGDAGVDATIDGPADADSTDASADGPGGG